MCFLEKGYANPKIVLLNVTSTNVQSSVEQRLHNSNSIKLNAGYFAAFYQNHQLIPYYFNFVRIKFFRF